MKILNMSKKTFEHLEPLKLDASVYNTEADMFLMEKKNRWNKNQSVLKKLHQDTGEIFSNKLYTVNELIEKKDEIGIEELVMPDSLAAVNNEIIGFTMPYVPNINFQQILDSNKYSLEQKVAYLKEIGVLLEKIKKAREYSRVKDFYLNDVHENNFILNTQTNKINVVDLDSAKIGHNLTAAARYLTPVSQLAYVPKYKKLEHSVGGCYEITNDTEIYCYIIIIFKFFYGRNIGMLSIGDFYVYLDYLSKIGVSKELLDKLALIYTGRSNENPYEYLDELTKFYGKTHRNTFETVRKRKIY